ncbi:MAG TPA: hypothetical protein VK061_08015 [Bacillota bacterium]|nr:hypothetical protein [Bacillota bacterium]
MKLPLRFFGIGLLTASLVFALSLYFFKDKNSSLESESIENIAEFLEDKGYHVISQEDYIAYSVYEQKQQEQANDEENNDNDNNEDDINENDENNTNDNEENNNDSNENNEDSDDESDDDSNEKEVYTYTLTVEENMLAPDISRLLENNNIIEDARDFTDYLEDEDYSRYIQLGEHKLSSDMTYNELAEKITSN